MEFSLICLWNSIRLYKMRGQPEEVLTSLKLFSIEGRILVEVELIKLHCEK